MSLSTTEREAQHRIWLRRIMEVGKTRTTLTPWEKQFVGTLAGRLVDRGDLNLSSVQANYLQSIFDVKVRPFA